MNDFPLLQTERLALRKITRDDQHNIFTGLSHPEVIKYYGVSFKTFEATQEQMDWYANLEETNTGKWWALTDISDGTFLGAGGYHDWHHKFQKAEIGFWLLPQYWGRGYMFEGMNALLDYAFSKMNLHRVEGYVDPANANCIRGLAKLGFKLEGTMRDCEKVDDQFIDCSIYAKLVTD